MPDPLLTAVMAGLAAGGLIGVALAPAAAAERLRARWPAVVVAAMAMVGAIALVVHAASPDGYYGDGVTVWDHAGRNGSRPLALAALALAPAAAGAALLARRTAWRAPTLLLGATACGAVLLAILGVSTGH